LGHARKYRYSARSFGALDTEVAGLVEGEQEESFHRFLRGGVLPKPGPGTTAWLAKVARWTTAGKQIRRVHIVTRPLSDYLRWELVVYRQQTSQAGEDIRIADATNVPWLAEVGPDFWLFDDAVPVECRYDTEGRWLGGEQATHDIGYYRQQRDLALAHAVPLADFQ